MRNYFFLIIALMSIFTACVSEDLTTMESDEMLPKGGAEILLGPDIVESNVTSLNFCEGDFLKKLGQITNNSAWSVGNSDVPGFIDYELEEAFRCSPLFSTCNVRLRQPVSTQIVEFWLADSGYTVFDIELGNIVVYDYLSDSITPSIAEELKEHFACQIKDYESTYYSDNTSYIINIDFLGDALLCTCPSGQSRYLKAKVTFYLY